MVRALCSTLAASAAAILLLDASPAHACEAHGKAPQAQGEPRETKAQQAAHARSADVTNVLAPVDEVLAATCNCSSASDCTCKKGECKCKKCSKSHGVKPAGKGSTRMMEPLKNQQRSPEVPQNAQNDATGGVLI